MNPSEFKNMLIAALSAASVGAILLDDVDAHAHSVDDNIDVAERFVRFIEGGDFNQFFEGEDPPPFNEADPPPGTEPPQFIQIQPPEFLEIVIPPPFDR